jgi:uncharacterized membrane protein SpoIIM required for sporulation
MKVNPMNIDLSFWKKASPKRKRIYSTILIFVIAVLVTILGTLVPLSAQEANQISNDINQTLTSNQASGTLPQYIFLNNFSINLLMFIPIIGPLLGFLILFSTGIALGAIASVQGYPALLGLALLGLTPVFWLEFVSYSIGITESIWLFRRLRQRRWRELKNTGILIGICAILLLIGAIVETLIISFAG